MTTESEAGMARTAVIALFIGVGLILLAFTLGLGPGALIVAGALLLGPTLWWRWKTREFRRGVRAMRRGQPDVARTEFRAFLDRVRSANGFLRYQPLFNLGRRYDYVSAAHNNLGVLALQAGDRETAAREFRAALDRARDFAPACYGLAAVRLLEGEHGAAEAAARQGLETNPGHRPCAIIAALARAERDDREGAEEILADLSKPIEWERARTLWSSMYRFWGEEARARRWD